MSLKQRIAEDMKAALRGGEAARLSAIRLLHAAVRQREIDGRVDLDDAVDDAGVERVVERLLKQRRDAITQFQAAGRDDLAGKEQFEVEVLSAYLPPPLSEAELSTLLEAALAETGASGPKDMGRVMAWLKPRLAGRADMGSVSARIKSALA